MSRNIPPVRQWRVRFYAGDRLIVSTVVETINKWFARQLANEACGYPAIRSDKITVSLVNTPKLLERVEHALR